MDIIYQQDVHTSVFLAKIQNLSVLKMIDQIIHELFCCDIQDFETPVFIEDAVTYGIHKVSFSQAGSAVNIKRIVGFCRIIHNSRGRCMSELIAGTDNEVFECVIGIQVGIEKAAVLGAAFMRGAAHKLIGRVFENIFDLE